ncbi:MAG: tetratricopeptide repeat protein [Planctomycetota bacterium]
MRPEPYGICDCYSAAGERYEALLERADAYTEAEDFANAAACYQAAAALAPEMPDAHVGLGMLHLQTDQLEAAEQRFTALADRLPDCSEAYTGLAAVQFRRERWPAAFELYLKALELDIENLLALLGLFQASCRMGTFAKIIDYLEIYLEAHPEDGAVAFCLATLYARESRWTAARDALQLVLSQAPDKPEALDLLETVEQQLEPGARFTPTESPETRPATVLAFPVPQ